jgi:hypothetical protein
MQHTHRLAYLAGHLLIDLPEGRFVVDTGSPASFGDSGKATYGGRTHVLPRSAGGIGLPELAGLGLEARIGARLRGLLGMDILGDEPVMWDGARGRAIVRPAAPAASLARVRVERDPTMGIPVITALVADRTMRLVFDTGAQFGYLAESAALSMGVDAGEFDDFHPSLGAIKSASAKIPVGLATQRVRERFGHHGPLSQGVLRPLGVDGILGCSWMRDRPVWWLPGESALVIG